MIRIAHIITGLGVGGAEAMLCKLVAGLDTKMFQQHVISLNDFGAAGQEIRRLGIPVAALGMGRNWPNPSAILRLASLLGAHQPDVVQTWMYHANLIGSIASLRARHAAVVWNIRRGRLDRHTDRRSTLWTSKACAALSRKIPSRIVCCSHSSRDWHCGQGYADSRMMVIPNGFDLSRFAPDAEARRTLRSELGIPDSSPLAGLVARFDPPKDHETFVRAAALLSRERPDAYFVLCGDRVDSTNARLIGWIRSAGIQHRCRLLGPRKDVARIFASLDVLISPSIIEGFPNAIGEAMACAVPCVVSDVGDSSRIVGRVGRVVPPRDPPAMARALADLLSMPREARIELGMAGRRRIAEKFSIQSVVRQYSNLYQDLA